MTHQKITRKNLKEIHDSVCENWQKTIKELILWNDNKEIEIQNNLILEGYNLANAKQKKLIEKYFKIAKPEDICNEIQDWSDILRINNIKKYVDVIPNAKTKEEKSINALNKMFLIAKAYNQGWIPNWRDTSEYKWRPYKYLGGGGISWLVDHCSYLCAPSGSHFKTEKLAKDALNKFKPIFEDFLYE